MGTEIIPLLIWLFGAVGILILVRRMIITRRWYAAVVAFSMWLLAYLPFCFVFGWDSLRLLQTELILALIIGVPALVYSGRWPIVVACLAAALVPAAGDLLWPSTLGDNSLLEIPAVIWGLTFFSAPVCIALASVFFVGAFVVRRPYRVCLYNPS